MTAAIELAKECGITYYLTPEGTTEMHGSDRQIESFAESVRSEALKDAADKFDGTTAYNWTAADGYSNAFDIASELRYMATETPNAALTGERSESELKA